MKYVHDELIKNGYRLVFEDHFDGDLNPDIWNITTMCQNGKIYGFNEDGYLIED